jgi:hypothetical protein
MCRGRWASSRSVRTYLQQGQALLLANRVPLAVHRRGARLASSLTRAMIIARRNTLASDGAYSVPVNIGPASLSHGQFARLLLQLQAAFGGSLSSN